MKIVAEDKAVETRTNDFMNDWERSKPVEGHLRPDEALQHLQMYESKFARLKEERDNVAKAKEALELQEPGKLLRILAVVIVKGHLRLDEAFQHLQMYESKFA